MTANTVDREGLQTNPQQGKPERGGGEKRDRRKGGYKMKRLLFGTILLALVLVFPIATMARADRIPLPPRIAFSAPPVVVVIPGTYVYGVPDVDVDIFFYQGWWWRPWEGRWYRSQNYNSGWSHYGSVPSFYNEIPSRWRNDYRKHRWGVYRWDYQRISHRQLQRNWSTWERDRYWEKHNTWGVKGFKPGTQSQQSRDRDRRDQDRGNDDREHRR